MPLSFLIVYNEGLLVIEIFMNPDELSTAEETLMTQNEERMAEPNLAEKDINQVMKESWEERMGENNQNLDRDSAQSYWNIFAMNEKLSIQERQDMFKMINTQLEAKAKENNEKFIPISSESDIRTANDLNKDDYNYPNQ